MTEKMKNIFYLEGNWFQRQRSIKKIKNFLKTFELFVFNETDSYNFVEQKIMEELCFEGKKLIILTNWPGINFRKKHSTQLQISKRKKKIKEISDKFKKILSNIPNNCFLILNNLENVSISFVSFIRKIGIVFEFPQKIRKTQALEYIIKYSKIKQKVIKEEDALYIIHFLNVFGNTLDLDELFLLFERIIHYIGDRKKITREDIVKTVFHSSNFVIWDLFNLLDKKNIKESFFLLNLILSSVENVKKEIYNLLCQLEWRYKFLYFIRTSFIKEKQREKIWIELSNLFKLSRKGSDTKIKMNKQFLKGGKERPEYTHKMLNFAFQNNYSKKEPLIFSYNTKQLLLINYTIEQSFPAVRNSSYDIEAINILEIIFLVICGKIRSISDLNFLKIKDFLI